MCSLLFLSPIPGSGLSLSPFSDSSFYSQHSSQVILLKLKSDSGTSCSESSFGFAPCLRWPQALPMAYNYPQDGLHHLSDLITCHFPLTALQSAGLLTIPSTPWAHLASGPLQLLFSLPGMLSPQLSAGLAASLPSFTFPD